MLEQNYRGVSVSIEVCLDGRPRLRTIGEFPGKMEVNSKKH
jgi:hypothetical protein